MSKTFGNLNVSYSNILTSVFTQAPHLYPGRHAQTMPQTMHRPATGGLIASVTDSKDNLFSSNLMPPPPKFSFQERSGRINWRNVMNIDIDKMVKEVDLRQLESLLQNLTYAHLDREDLERLGDAHFVKLFRLSQLSIEYLIYTQNYLETLTTSLDLHYQNSYAETAKIRSAIQKQSQENKTLKKELKLKQKTLTTYEYLLKLPAEQDQEFYKCKQCPKFFISTAFLQKHYARSHPHVKYQDDFKTEADLERHPAGNSKVLTETAQTKVDYREQQRQNEQMFQSFRSELQGQLEGNLKQIEVQINDIKHKQETLNTKDQRNER